MRILGWSFVLVVFLVPATAFAGAWDRPPGDCYGKLWARGLFGSAAFSAEGGETVPTAPYQDVSLNHYIECGMPYRLTAFSSGQPFGWAKYDDNSTPYVGLVGVGLRRGFLEGPFRIGVQVEGGAQGILGDEDLADGTTPEGLVYRPAVSAITGQAKVAAGYGTSWGWLSFDVGAQVWSEEIPVALVMMAQVGYRVTDWLTLDLHVPVRQHFEEITVTNVAGTGATNYIGFGIGASFALSDSFGITAAFQGATATSNASTPSLLLGVERRDQF